MKSCEQITLDLLKKREIYQLEQKRKKNMMVKSISSLCCMVIVVLVGIAVYKGGVLTLPDLTDDDNYTDNSSAEDQTDRNVDDTTAGIKEVNSDVIIDKINIMYSIDSMPESRMNIALMYDDFVEMTADEMRQYYGTDFLPELPNDLTLNKGDRYGVFKRNGGEGDIYWDVNKIMFANDDHTKIISIDISKGKVPFVCFLPLYEREEISVINGNDVFMGAADDGRFYYAEFLYGSAGFRIMAEGVTEDEFINVIRSIVK